MKESKDEVSKLKTQHAENEQALRRLQWRTRGFLVYTPYAPFGSTKVQHFREGDPTIHRPDMLVMSLDWGTKRGSQGYKRGSGMTAKLYAPLDTYISQEDARQEREAKHMAIEDASAADLRAHEKEREALERIEMKAEDDAKRAYDKLSERIDLRKRASRRHVAMLLKMPNGS